jgi:hypothetical protein
MSDTPETDAAIKEQSEWKLPFVSTTMGGVTYDGPVATLCRKLERERDEARVVAEQLYDAAAFGLAQWESATPATLSEKIVPALQAFQKLKAQ